MDNGDLILDISNGTFDVDKRSCGPLLCINPQDHRLSHFLMVQKSHGSKGNQQSPLCSLNMSFL